MGLPALRLILLGGFSLTCSDELVRVSRNCQRLLAFMALADRPQRREYVAWSLWPDHRESRALGSLRTALWRLPRPTGVLLFDDSDDGVRLSDSVEIDWRACTRRIQRVLTGDEQADARLVTALATDLLPDWYEDWLVLPREQFRQLRLHALETVAARSLAGGCAGDALQTALLAVACEPLRESAHRCVIAAHLAEGNHSEALRQYNLYIALLDSAGLPVCPSEALAALMQNVPSSDPPRAAAALDRELAREADWV